MQGGLLTGSPRPSSRQLAAQALTPIIDYVTPQPYVAIRTPAATQAPSHRALVRALQPRPAPPHPMDCGLHSPDYEEFLPALQHAKLVLELPAERTVCGSVASEAKEAKIQQTLWWNGCCHEAVVVVKGACGIVS